MEGILLRILWVFGRGMSYWPVYRGWPVYRWPVWEVSLYMVYSELTIYSFICMCHFNIMCILLV